MFGDGHYKMDSKAARFHFRPIDDVCAMSAYAESRHGSVLSASSTQHNKLGCCNRVTSALRRRDTAALWRRNR
jgi:hypothetical protein